jgi:hypothetical protein
MEVAAGKRRRRRESRALRQLYIEDVRRILIHLSTFRTRRASFSFRKRRHAWLHGGAHPPLESRILREALALLGVPHVYEKGNTHSRVIIEDTDALRAALSSPHLDDVLREAYRRAVSRSLKT